MFEVEIFGTAFHRSCPDLGIDSISKAGYFLVGLKGLAKIHDDKAADLPSIHVGVIKGGEEVRFYPARCKISIGTRPIAGQTTETMKRTLRNISQRLAATVPDSDFAIHPILARSSHFIATEYTFVELVVKHATEHMGARPTIREWLHRTDMALLAEIEISGVIWRPKGYRLHSKPE